MAPCPCTVLGIHTVPFGVRKWPGHGDRGRLHHPTGFHLCLQSRAFWSLVSSDRQVVDPAPWLRCDDVTLIPVLGEGSVIRSAPLLVNSLHWSVHSQNALSSSEHDPSSRAAHRLSSLSALWAGRGGRTGGLSLSRAALVFCRQ